ncbi:NAD(P)/FAD-dependent oxidoreductase [Thalassotalea castellviae]|uniref:FAD-binding oxidoreductase n=1 Tax=Thalassotalea castellviae TaxID=3075612 RepID=A0ABU3A2V7_9GAMM|nr:FAD-binding oxidoreductase [Thalassotalea sp. W431]MDT0603902.1 FAD-binding oxidoreductase [Thalassotalea sp. W431]
MIVYPDSYYAASANREVDYPALAESLTADICVVGGGYSGLATAIALQEKGYQVVLLEGAKIGYGASGRNGGQLVNSFSRDIDHIEKHYGLQTAEALGGMAFEGADCIRDLIKRYNIDCDYKQGGFFAAFTDKQLKGLEQKQKLWQHYGNDKLTLVDQSSIKNIVDTNAYVGGLVDEHCGHIHPLKLALGEAAALVKIGGKVFEQSKVLNIEELKASNDKTVIVKTAQGQVTAKKLVLAGNAYMGNLQPELAKKSMPCGTQIVTTEILPAALAQSLIPSQYCVEDVNYKLDYYRITADNRLLFGGGVTYGGGDPASIESFLKPHMDKIFPAMKDYKIDYAWGGDFLLTLNRLPQLGRIGENIYYTQGYSGHGVNTSHLAGKLLAEAIHGDSSRFDVFAQLPHYNFPGGRLFRVPAVIMGAWYYGLRDKLGL